MRILLLGSQGQIGQALRPGLASLGELIPADRARCDLADEQGLRRLVRGERPDVVVNAAAYTAVDRAEQESALAMQVNAVAPGILAEEAQALGALLVHYSTDYIFSGDQPAAYREDDLPGPRNIYGQSKLKGEQHVRRHAPRHLILRTGWIYSSRGGNFLTTMLQLLRERDTVDVVHDQTGAPTAARQIADITVQLLVRHNAEPQNLASNGKFPYGTYHVAAQGKTSRYGYACFIADTARRAGMPLRAQTVRPIRSDQFPLPADRPANTCLDTAKLHATFGLSLPPWREGVQQVVEDVTAVFKAGAVTIADAYRATQRPPESI